MWLGLRGEEKDEGVKEGRGEETGVRPGELTKLVSGVGNKRSSIQERVSKAPKQSTRADQTSARAAAC